MEPITQLVLFALVQLVIAGWCGRDAARGGHNSLAVGAAVLALALVGPAVLVLAINMAARPLTGWVGWLWLLSTPGILAYLALRSVLAAVDRLECAVYERESRRREGE